MSVSAYTKHGSGSGFQNGETLTAEDVNKIETALAAHAAELIAQEASLTGKLDKVTGTLESVSILSADTIVSLLGDAEIAAAAALASASSTEEQTGEPEEQEPEEQGQEGDG